MWVFVLFDLPTVTKKQKKQYATFRKHLLNGGFVGMQYSVYMRHCGSQEAMEVHIRRIKKYLPPEGRVSILHVTDKQFSMIEHFWGKEEAAKPKPHQQLELF
jgi:CRISPR-associated protein Cas2